MKQQVLESQILSIQSDIVEKILEGRCILFLGAMASASTPAGSRYSYKRPTPSATELAQNLAKAIHYPWPDDTNLQRVALYAEVGPGGSRGRLVNLLSDELKLDDDEPSHALRMLAALPFRIIITTNYDHRIEHALRDAKAANGRRKDPIVRVYAPKSQAEEVPLDPDEQRPVLLKLHGDVDRKESLVITEEDYLTFIERMASQHEHPIHPNLRSRLGYWPVLFIGYSLKDYNLRLLFRTLRWHIDPANFPLCFAVDPEPDALVVSIWQDGRPRIVGFIRADLWTFVPELYKACVGSEYIP